MAFAIILLETFAVYLMIMASIHTDILAIRLKRLGEHTTVVKGMDQIERHRRDHLLLIECFQNYSVNTRYGLALYRKLCNSIYSIDTFLCFSFQKSFQNVFSIPLFIQFLVSGAILCVTVFQIVMVFRFSIFIQFLYVAKAFQAFRYRCRCCCCCVFFRWIQPVK